MGRRKVPGLVMLAGSWHIDKHVFGRRVCQSTGTARLEEHKPTEGAPDLDRQRAPRQASLGRLAAVDSRAATFGYLGGDHQPCPADRPAHPEHGGRRVDG
jgi:hypothetical protein